MARQTTKPADVASAALSHTTAARHRNSGLAGERVTDRSCGPKPRPSGHDISRRFADNNGGAIPSNLLQIPNTESNSPYQRHCATVGVKPHPARFPEKLPTCFIEFLTDPGDTVLDILASSNTAGTAAEKLDRRWMALENDRACLAAFGWLFMNELPAGKLTTLWNRLHSDDLPVVVKRRQEDAQRNPFGMARRSVAT
jgi:site-specific DNA-methyltransferase (cytosine-N4-specific)